MKERRELESQLSELRAVVERLPKTKDGVVISDSETPVFYPSEPHAPLYWDGYREGMAFTRSIYPGIFVSESGVEISSCYSTPEAAEAAKGGE